MKNKSDPAGAPKKIEIEFPDRRALKKTRDRQLAAAIRKIIKQWREIL
jgi:hypothetical protein